MPTHPIQHWVYRCDKKFIVDLVKSNCEENTIKYGLVLVEGEEVQFYQLCCDRGNIINHKLITKFAVYRDKRQKKGGQSAHRFQMNRLGQIDAYVKKISDTMNRIYDDTNIEKIVIAGSGDIKDQVFNPERLIPGV